MKIPSFKFRYWFKLHFVFFGFLMTQVSYALFLDGEGNYGLQGETQSRPGFSSKKPSHQAIKQNFRLLGEARLNEKSSFFMELSLFDNPRSAWLGDQPKPSECSPRKNQVVRDTSLNEKVEKKNGTDVYRYEQKKEIDAVEDSSCEQRHQSTGEPGYKPYTPKITKAYVKYAFDYCLLEAGRRGRDWGLGILLDSGSKPFSSGASIFDGATCKVNIQKTQTLGFSFGYDKLTETGEFADHPADDVKSTEDDRKKFRERKREFGASNSNDDIDQYFLAIEFDDRIANAGSGFTKNIGVYFANVASSKNSASSTDLKYFDLYTGFFVNNLSLRNEILFRIGRSGDPNWTRYGGVRNESGEPAVNKLQSIAYAGVFDWVIARSGSYVGPAEYNQGTIQKHIMFFEYAHAPGDSDGYYSGAHETISEDKRNKEAKAIAFHRNFKPALILFNGHPDTDSMRVDGVYDPGRVMNVNLFGTGYRYESFEGGNFEAKLITAQLFTSMPKVVKEYYYDKDRLAIERPVGFGGSLLGYELDLKYTYYLKKELELGIAAAGAIPGNAYRIYQSSSPSQNFLIQSTVNFKF